MLVRPLQPDDYHAVAAIFAEGIATGLATFETEVPSWEEWDAAHLPEHRFVAELDGDVVGWVAVVPYSRRASTAASARRASTSPSGRAGRGVGRALLEAVIESARDGGLWTLQAGIFPDNARSSSSTAGSASARSASASGSASSTAPGATSSCSSCASEACVPVTQSL